MPDCATGHSGRDAPVTTAIPPVSVGLPVRNGMPYLIESLNSILMQTYTDFELLICDNASTDETEEFARELVRSDSRVRYLRIESDSGASANFNRCVAETRGGLFTWAASDDRYLPSYLEECIAHLATHDDHMMCVPAIRFIDESGLVVGELRQPVDIGSPNAASRLRAYLDRRSWYMAYGVACRDALVRTGLLPQDFGPDVILIWEMLLRFRIGTLPEALVEYRRYRVKEAGAVWRTIQPEGSQSVPRWLHVSMLRNLLACCEREDLEPTERAAGRRALLRWLASTPLRDLVVDDLREELRRPDRRPNPIFEGMLLAAMAALRPGRAVRVIRRRPIRQVLGRGS